MHISQLLPLISLAVHISLTIAWTLPVSMTLSPVTSSSSISPNIPILRRKLPVTVISGFLGAGKTTLLKHILQSDHGEFKYAVIVNDMSELNIDEALIKPHIRFQEEKLIEMSNGCICCTLRDDLLVEVARLASSNLYDHLIIESTGISEPLAVAETFTMRPDNVTSSLFELAEIDTMVTVVDAANFICDMARAEELRTRNLQSTDADDRTITDLLTAQIEFADVVLINKIDRVSVRQFNKINQIVRSLNSEAAVLSAVKCKINLEEIIDAKRFDMERTAQSPAWVRAINAADGEKIPESEEYNISSFVYRSRRPFNPSRLFAFVKETLNQEDATDAKYDIHYPRVLRSKGFFWLASRPTEMLIWSQAGGLFQLSPGGLWIADSPPDIAAEALSLGEVDWTDGEGDRRQELVFIGTAMSEAEVRGALDACLLSDEEALGGRDSWVALEDPFPSTEEEFALEEEEGRDVGR